MTESELEDLAAAYALGALDEAEAARFEAALEARPELRQRVAEYAESAAHVALSLDPIRTSPESKSKLIAYASGSKLVTVPSAMKTQGGAKRQLPGAGLAWLVAGVLAVLLAGMGWLALAASDQAVDERAKAAAEAEKARALEGKLDELRQRLDGSLRQTAAAVDAANQRAAEAEAKLERVAHLEELLRDPETRVFHLVSKEGEPAHGRVVLRGKELLFFGYDLPRLADESYELWLQTPAGDLKASGVFTESHQVDRTVQGRHVLPAPLEAKGFALSREPTKEGDPVQNKGPVVLVPAP